MPPLRPSFGVRVYKEYFNFASAHFLVFPDGAREELHGHNYQVRVAAEGELGAGDMVIDFCRLKPVVRRLCQALDHRMLLPAQAPGLVIADEDDGHVSVRYARREGGVDRFLFPRRDVALLPITNTTTERLAELLSGQLLAALAVEHKDARLSRLELEVEESSGQCGVHRVELRP